MLSSKLTWMHGNTIGLFALPALTVLGFLIGPLLIVVLSVGYILCYMTHKLENVHLSITLIVLMVGISELIAAYYLVPLLWLNVGNLSLLILFHFFLGHTALWLIVEIGLSFKEFPPLEVFLFTTYPAACTGIYAWFLASVFNHEYLPYYLMIVGFIIFQICCKPRYATVQKKDAPLQQMLEPNIIGIVMVGLCFVPLLIYGWKTLFTNYQRILGLYFWLEGVFIFSQSSFLATLLPIKSFLSFAGIHKSRVIIMRWTSGLTALFLLLPVAKNHGFETQIMVALKGKVLLFILLTAFISYRSKKVFSGLVSLLVIGLYLWQIGNLPWGFRYISADTFFMDRIYILIGVSLISTIACLWLFVYATRVKFSLALCVSILVFHYVEWQLYSVFMIHHVILLLSSALTIYALVILRRNERLKFNAFLVCLGVVCTKLMLLILHYLEGKRLLYHLSSILAVFALSTVALYSILAQDMKNILTSFAKLIAFSGCVFFPLVILAEPILLRLLHNLFDVQLHFLHIVGIGCILCGVLLSRSLANEEIDLPYRAIGPLLVSSGLAVLLAFSYLAFSWSLVLSGVFVVGVALSLSALWIHANSQTVRSWFCVAASLELGCGVAIWIVFEWNVIGPFKPLLLSALLMCLVGTGAVAFVMPSMRQTVVIPKLFAIGSVMSLMLTVVCLVSGSDKLPLCGAVCAFYIGSALILRLSEGKRMRDEVVVQLSPESPFAPIGNLAVLISLVAGLLALDWDFGNPLVPFLALFLFGLQRSPTGLLSNLSSRNQHCPPMAVLTVLLLVATISQSPIVSDNSDIPRYWRAWYRTRSWAEVLASVALLSIHVTYLLHSWRPSGQPADRQKTIRRHYSANENMLALVLMPICLVFLVGTSYAAYLNGAYSFVVTALVLLNF